MNSLFSSLAPALFMTVIGSIGGWFTHAFKIRQSQLQIKVPLKPSVKAVLQNEIDVLVPKLASSAEAAAFTAVEGMATHVAAKLIPAPAAPIVVQMASPVASVPVASRAASVAVVAQEVAPAAPYSGLTIAASPTSSSPDINAPSNPIGS